MLKLKRNYREKQTEGLFEIYENDVCIFNCKSLDCSPKNSDVVPACGGTGSIPGVRFVLSFKSAIYKYLILLISKYFIVCLWTKNIDSINHVQCFLTNLLLFLRDCILDNC